MTRLAGDALVMMAVGVAAPWKIPFGYFLNNGISGETLKNIVNEAIVLLTECYLKVVAVTCDALAANVSMAKLFGCRVHETSSSLFQTSFPHPKEPSQKVSIIFDAAHGLKLLRNLLGDNKVLRSSEYGKVEWGFIEKLQDLQEAEGLRAANKLRRNHIEYYRQIMKVKLAAQTFSSSVSKSLNLALQLKLEQFRGYEGTARFIADVDW